MNIEESLLKAKILMQNLDAYLKTNHFIEITDGVLRYIPDEIDKEKIVICFSGRNCDPKITTEGMHLTATFASMLGYNSFISSAHDSSRRMTKSLVIQEIEKYGTNTKIFIFGHSHGADHASIFAKELRQDFGIISEELHTIDPINSPWPFPLTRIADTGSIKKHINYYQRNFLFFGGNIKTATKSHNVSNYKEWPSLSKLLKTPSIKKPRITHCTIDLDLLLGFDLIEGLI